MDSEDRGHRFVPARSGNQQPPSVDLFASVPATIWTTDERLIVTFVDGVYLRRLKIDPAAVIGRSVASILLDGREDHPMIQAHLTALHGLPTTVAIEWGGKLFNVRLAPLRDPNGRIVGCVGVHLEISDTPDEDGTLRESDVRLRRVVDSNMIGIAFGNDEGRISDANDAFLQLTGYEREDLTADAISWPAMVPMTSQQRHVEALEEILSSGRCTPFETEIVRKDGSRVPVLVGAARLSIRRREGVAFVLDITDRKKTVHRLKVELACADALADAVTADDAAACVLRIVARNLPFRSAAVWSLSADEWHLAARIGEPAAGSRAIQPSLQEAHATGQNQSIPSRELLVLPTADMTGESMLVLAGWQNGEPDQELVDTCRRIAGRLGKALTKAR